MHRSSLIPIEGHDGLYRDPQTHCIVNADANSYSKYVSERQRKKERDLKVETTEKEVQLLKEEISEIKSLLLSLLNKDSK